MPKIRKAVTADDFRHLDRPMSPEMAQAFRAACTRGAVMPTAQRVDLTDPHAFDHLNGPEFAASAKADAIIAAAANARTPTSAPDATGLAGRIVRAALKVVRL